VNSRKVTQPPAQPAAAAVRPLIVIRLPLRGMSSCARSKKRQPRASGSNPQIRSGEEGIRPVCHRPQTDGGGSQSGRRGLQPGDRGVARLLVNSQASAGQQGGHPQCGTSQGPARSSATEDRCPHRAAQPVGGYPFVGPGAGQAGECRRTDAGQTSRRFSGCSQVVRRSFPRRNGTALLGPEASRVSPIPSHSGAD
jgi:hypothetical protein